MERLTKELEFANERLNLQSQQLNAQELLEKSFATHNRDVSSILGDGLKDNTQTVMTALHKVQAQQTQMFACLENLSSQLQDAMGTQKGQGDELEQIHECMNKQTEQTSLWFQDVLQKMPLSPQQPPNSNSSNVHVPVENQLIVAKALPVANVIEPDSAPASLPKCDNGNEKDKEDDEKCEHSSMVFNAEKKK